MLWRVSSPRHYPAGFIEPCLPTVSKRVPEGPQWIHEIKHDGYRMIVRRDGDRVRLFTRRGFDGTPVWRHSLRSLRVSSVTFDGEMVVCDEDGISVPDQPGHDADGGWDVLKLGKALGERMSRQIAGLLLLAGAMAILTGSFWATLVLLDRTGLNHLSTPIPG